MEQLLLHLIGDYLTQSHWMASEKTKRWWPALAHSIVYSAPFLLIGSWVAVLVIWSTHFVIDHWRLARFVVYGKNRLLGASADTWADCSSTGYHKDVPAWLAVWLLIAADNTLHLCINYMALRFL